MSGLIFDLLGKAEYEGSNTAGRNGGSSNDNNAEKGGSDDRGPSILSVDQSAITGESLAVDKCSFFFLRVSALWLT